MSQRPDPDEDPIPLTPLTSADTPASIRSPQEELPLRVRCPLTVIFAGILWILLGLGLIASAINGLVVSSGGMSAPVAKPTPVTGQKTTVATLSDGTSDIRLTLLVGAIVAVPLALLFVVLGTLALGGSAPRVLVSGILSVVVGVGLLTSAVTLPWASEQTSVALVLNGSLGLAAVVGGVLALVGNGQFVRWKAARKEFALQEKELALRQKLDAYNAKIAAEPDDTEADWPPPVKKVKFPPSVQLAAVAWWIVGLFQLGSAILSIAVFAGGDSGLGGNSKPVRQDPMRQQPQPQPRPQAQAQEPKDGSQAATGGMLCGAAFGLLVAAAFGITSLQALKGSVSSVTGAGVASVILGLFGLIGALLLLASEKTAIPGGVSLVTVVLMLVGGAGAIAGGSQYKQWRKWKRAQADEKKREARAAKVRRDRGGDDDRDPAPPRE